MSDWCCSSFLVLSVRNRIVNLAETRVGVNLINSLSLRRSFHSGNMDDLIQHRVKRSRLELHSQPKRVSRLLADGVLGPLGTCQSLQQASKDLLPSESMNALILNLPHFSGTSASRSDGILDDAPREQIGGELLGVLVAGLVTFSEMNAPLTSTRVVLSRELTDDPRVIFVLSRGRQEELGILDQTAAQVLSPMIDKSMMSYIAEISATDALKLKIFVMCQQLQRPNVLNQLRVLGSSFVPVDPMVSQLLEKLRSDAALMSAGDTSETLDALARSMRWFRSKVDYSTLGTYEKHPALLTDLFEHQRQGVMWMISREDRDKQPSLVFSDEALAEASDLHYLIKYVERRSAHQSEYINTLTGDTRSERPRYPLGGFLSDEMGLGSYVCVCVCES